VTPARRWALALGLAALGVCSAALAISAGTATSALAATSAGVASSGSAASPSDPRLATGQLVLRLTDTSRQIRRPGHRPVPRTLVTIVRYPRASGPFPLIVFAHGFDVTPAPYAPLLESWAQAGYVVAAPIFPLTRPGAPGGPDEDDLVNQPGDVSFVISRLLAASASGGGALSGRIDPARIAVTGQSDGGSTALAVAYNRHFRDRRIDAAVILSGARIPGVGGYDFQAPSPPLLAVQGTADTVNVPESTYIYFRLAHRPKFLLSLFGAPHLGPYTDEQPQLTIVERVTLAFLDRYLKHEPGARRRMWRDGDVPGVAALSRSAPRH
jgi:dienelactone hydrolase